MTNIWDRAKSPQTLVAQAKSYLEWLEAKNYSRATLATRRMYLKSFLRWCQARGIEKTRDVTGEIIEGYRRHLCRRYSKQCKGPLSENSRNLYLRSVALLFGWLERKGRLLYNPMDAVELPAYPKKLPRTVLTAREVELVISEPDITTPLGLRDRAILETLYSTGMRRGELVALEVADVDFKMGTVMVHGKGQKDRVVPIGKRALEWIEKYLCEVRSLLLRDRGEKALFINRLGSALKHLSPVIGKYVKQAGLEKGGSCHLIRHTMATLMLENGADIRYIQEILGHERLTTTQIYTRVSIKKLKEVHDRAHPAGDSVPDTAPPSATSSPAPYPHIEKPGTLREFWQKEGELIARGNEYLQSLTNYSKLTVRQHSMQLAGFIRWCDDHAVTAINSVTKDMIEAYQNHLVACRNAQGEPLSAGWRCNCLCTVANFFTWLTQRGDLLYNPTGSIDYPKLAKRLPARILSTEDVDLVLAIPDTTTVDGVRDRAILETFYSTGIRRCELLKLEISHVNFDHGTIIVEGKGKKDRVVPIGTGALTWIEKYLNEARPQQLPEPQERTLFITKYGRPFHVNNIGRLVRNHIRAAGFKGSCHLLRHTMATLMLENGADVRYIQEILGHSDLVSTQIYTKVSIAKLKEVHARTHPASSPEEAGAPRHS